MTVKEELVSIAKRLEAIAESLEGNETEISLEELRAVLVNTSRVSKENQDAVKAILKSHGANKLSELATSEYREVLEEVQSIE